MKSIFASILTALLALSGGTTGAETTEQTLNEVSNYNAHKIMESVCPDNGVECVCGNYVDDDNDGVCDNYDDKACRQRGFMHGYSNYIDNDNDGICDNYTGHECFGKGKGHGGRCNK